MTQFRGNITNKLDKKGRVSVPATFRDILAGEGLVLRRSWRHPCIEAWPASRFESEVASTGPLDELTEEDDHFAYAMCSDVVDLSPDSEGRVVLPEQLIAHANLSEGVTFMARRSFFELWEPTAAAAQIEASRAAMVARLAKRRAANDGEAA